MSDPLRYRADIDGLRAIAVVVVILFHLGFERFSGGYVGVDVFFVISGFLITRMIRAQLGAESFSFSGFYVRRARRLFPALFVTVVASFVAACVLLAPQHLERVGGSTVSALFAVSNFYFWRESGYFDAEATLKPLLHTWSLGVEEQFYLLWPALLVVLLRCSSRAVLGFLGAASVASLALGEYWLVSDPAAAFYLLPARVVELALGAAMVWLVDRTPRQRLLLEPLVWIGLSLILYAASAYDDTTDFPGLNSLVPCIGAALLVYAGEARYSGWVLRNRLAVGIGLISYPLYLIHWPLLVFARYAKAEALDDFDRLAVAGFSLAGAAAIYRFVENPIRQAIRRERHLSAGAFGLACLGLAVFAALPAALAWLQGGWVWRLPTEIQDAARDTDLKRFRSLRYVEDEFAQQAFDPTQTNVLVVGDSHAVDFYNALHLNTERFPGFEFRYLSLDDKCFYRFDPAARNDERKRATHDECTRVAEAFRSSALVDTADYVVVSSRWKPQSLQYLDAFHRHLIRRGPELVLLGRSAEFDNVPDLVVRFGRLRGIERYVASHRRTGPDELNRRIEEKAGQLSVRYRDKLPFLCSSDRATCDVFDRDGNLLYYDDSHWTVAGARHFGARMAASGFLADL